MKAYMKQVALKFCGGCDPDYDRIEYWEKIRLAAGDRIQWVGPEDDCRFALVICGCKKACPADDLDHLPRLLLLTDDELGAEHVVTCLLEEVSDHADHDQRRLHTKP